MKGRRNSRFQTHRQIGKQAGCESHHHMSANGSWMEAAERLGSWHRIPEAKRASDALTQNHQRKTQNPASCSIRTNTMSLMFLKLVARQLAVYVTPSDVFGLLSIVGSPG